MSSPPAPPQHLPTAAELDDLALLVSGALAPDRSYNRPGSPITLRLPSEVEAAASSAGAVELIDPEGTPLAVVAWPTGEIRDLAHQEHGPFRSLQLSPTEYREQNSGRVVVPVTDALSIAQLNELAQLGPVTLLALTGAGTPSLSAPDLVRVTLEAARRLPDAIVVAVPLASHGDLVVDQQLTSRVIATYAGSDPAQPAPARTVTLDRDTSYPPEVAAVLERARPTPDRQGLVVFFTGLSGSGKSTLARALVDRILERSDRALTSLDGDVVRRHLSTGLSFSRADRETNIRRIGWVAAEISRHGGVAVASPIAPFEATREQVRSMVSEAGGAFFLIHVATPLAECERRDRKGLYARARTGEIPDFTGISSPYEEPTEPAVRVDTTGLTVEEALRPVLAGLRDRGYLALLDAPGPDARPLRVLFVCTANICRSPSLELLAREAMPDEQDVIFASAGTHGYDGASIDAEVARALPGGIDTSTFRSRRLTLEMLQEADLVLTVEAAHRSLILDEHPSLFRRIFTLPQFVDGLDRVQAPSSREALLEALGEHRGVADPALDIADPYRRGPDAAVECLNRLQDLLARALPALRRRGRPTTPG